MGTRLNLMPLKCGLSFPLEEDGHHVELLTPWEKKLGAAFEGKMVNYTEQVAVFHIMLQQLQIIHFIAYKVCDTHLHSILCIFVVEKNA